MSVFPKEIIEATTDAATSGKFNTIGTATIMSDVLVGRTEKVTLQQTRDGSTWLDVMLNGVVQTLDRKHTQLTIAGPGVYRVVKTVTASAVGVTLWRTEAN
jgi:hypothetical protein